MKARSGDRFGSADADRPDVGVVPRSAAPSNDFVACRLATELASIRSEVDQGRRDHILRSLDERGTAQELVRQQYTGRYAFELLQNANDAAASTPSAAPSSVRFVLTPTALIVANMGQPFGVGELEAICTLGRSSKDPRKSVGYKGLGFKSVGEITGTPQVFSPPHMFGFDAPRVVAAVSDVAGVLPPQQHLPVYAFPFPLELADAGEDVDEIQQCFSDGFVTAIRLPFRSDARRDSVRADLNGLLVPELLLFLDATDVLQVRGAGADFDAERQVQPADDHVRVELSANGAKQAWLVWREKVPVPDATLVAALGETWRHVTHVTAAAAVPLSGDERPCEGARSLPLHVYFPTEDSAGLPVLVHADFALDLDRRHIARTPEAAPYNEWLTAEVVKLLTDTVAPRLVQMFPDDASSINLLAPHAPEGVGGQQFAAAYDDAIVDSAFVPCRDGIGRRPADVLMLPDGMPDAGNAERWLKLTDIRELLKHAQLTPRAEAWLRSTLGVSAMSISDAVGRLREPEHDDAATYGWLLAWEVRAGSRLTTALREVPCVRTTARGWRRPEQVFFPRKKDGPDLPADVPVYIAAVPELPGLPELLSESGVRPFGWRDLVAERVLPLLTDPDTDPDLRRRAHIVLAAYSQHEGSGDRDILARLRTVLVRAHDGEDRTRTLAPAGKVYFSRAWTGDDALERLYGSSERCEFLAELVPADEDERADAFTYFRWLGVTDVPRVLSARADLPDRYHIGNLNRHPHADFGNWWISWQHTPEFLAEINCVQGHSWSQQLQVSYGLDRLDELLATGDQSRLLLLAHLLAANWARYRDAMTATITCRHGSHRGDRSRIIPSLLAHMLTSAQWLPCRHAGAQVLAVPADAWRAAPHLPKRGVGQLRLLDETLDQQCYSQAWQDLGVVDGARPDAHDLVALLRILADEPRPDGADDGAAGLSADVVDVARWAMRELDDALARYPGNQPSATDVPLLARSGDTFRFTAHPYVAANHLLTDAWSDEYPILVAEGDARVLKRWADIAALEDLVEAYPDPQRVHPGWAERIEATLNTTKPYLAAVAMDAAPSISDRLVPRLRGLEVVVCEQLSLRYRLGSLERTISAPTTYIHTRTEGDGPRSRTIGRAYIEIPTEDGDPDWYTFGPALAEFLLAPRQADAFTLLLTATREQRREYLRSKQIGDDKLGSARQQLQLLVEDTVDPLPDISDDFTRKAPRAASPHENSASGPVAAPSGHANDTRPAEPSSVEQENPQPLADEHVSMQDVFTGTVTVPSATSVKPSTGGGNRSVDWTSSVLLSQDRGRRGEKWVLRQERYRVEAAGMDPDLVIWQSNNDPESNFDIRSVDDTGEYMYIEVKSTARTDAAAPFEISSGELKMALRYRRRYWVYRVLDVNSERPTILRYCDPVGMLESNTAALRVASARMYLAPPPSERSSADLS